MQTLPCNFNGYKSWRHAWSQSLGNTTRGTSRVQFADIYKEDGLVSKPPALFTSMRQPMHGTSRPNKVSTKVYMLDRKIWKLFRPYGNRLKRTKCDQFFCSTFDFFDFCNPCFFYHSLLPMAMMWIYLLTMPIGYAEICDHSLFTLQFC